MSLSKCMSVVERLSEQDQAALLARADQLAADGMSANKAALQAAIDLMADLQRQAAGDVRRSAARDQTETDEFKRWFGQSKVVDKKGNPKIVYHGSVERGITEFDTSRVTERTDRGDEAGTYFTDDQLNATGYARPRLIVGVPKQERKFGSVTAAYLSLQNPLNTTADIKRGLKRGLRFEEAKREALKKLDRAVHDGIIFDGAGPAHSEYVAFRPEQIKSATGNSGEFDPSNPDIRRSADRSDPPTEEQRVVQDGIDGGSLSQAVKFVMEHDPNKARRVVAETVLRRLGELQREGVMFELNVAKPGDAVPRALRSSRGVTQWKGGVATSVWLNGMDVRGRSGMAFETVLHEAVHAATMASIQIGGMQTATGTDIAKHVDDLYEVSNAIVNHLNKRFIDAAAGQAELTDFEQAIFDGRSNALRDPHEVISWALTNGDAQAYLEGIQYRGSRSLWDAFVGAVRVALGLRARHDTALSEVLRVSGRIMSSPVAGLADASDMTGIALQQDVRPSADRSQTETPAFRRWFGDSKVVDDAGNPLVVYHGTVVRDSAKAPGMGDIRAFDRMFTTQFRAPSLDTVGSWFSTNPGPGGAEMYSGTYPGSAIYPVYLSIQNPQVTTFQLMQRRARLLHNGKDDGRQIGAEEVAAYRKWLGDTGKDGIKIEGSGNDGSTEFDNQVAWIALEPGQIKSATGNAGTFDPADADITRSAPRPVFYSQLQRAISDAPARMDAMSAPQWKLWLDANAAKAGVKKEEVEWSGIKDYLDMRGKDKVSRADVAAYLADSGVRVTETKLGDFDPVEEIDKLSAALEPLGYRAEIDSADGYSFVFFDRNDNEVKYGDLPPEAVAVVRAEGERRGPGTKYESYVVPGGQNYREVLITLPDRTQEVWMVYDPKSRKNKPAKVNSREGALQEAGGDLGRIMAVDQADRSGDYKSSHWDPYNILAHLRVDDRTDADGKRVLFVHELQSDWAQQGRKEGIRGAVPTDAQVREFFGLDADVDPAEYRDEMMQKMNKRGSKAVPAAPFIGDTKSWVSLALKRAIMMAVNGGYDRVALITGEQAAGLYSLEKQVSKITWTTDAGRAADGSGRLRIWGLDGEGIFDQTVDAKELEDHIGKELAVKLIESPVASKSGGGRDVREVEGDGLKVGGEGMRAFYDEIVPQVARDVLKRVGGDRMQQVTLVNTDADFDFMELDEATPEELEQLKGDGMMLQQPGFDITDSMRAKLADGAPLFSRARDIDLDKFAVAGGYTLGDLMKSAKKVSWWDRTVGSMFNMAEKNPEFKRVYDEVQDFIGDISKYATRAADRAPTILPKLETIRDIARQPLSVEDTKALSAPVFEGTLFFTRDADGNAVRTDDVGAAGVVWRDEELRERFGLNDAQIGMYREARRAINKSLTDLGVTDMLRYVGKDAAGVHDAVLAASTAQHAAQILEAELQRIAELEPARAAVMADTIRGVKEKAQMVHGLIAKGYAPLSRFGDYTVYVTRDGGKEQVFFGMYETEREANKAARAFKTDPELQDADIKTGTMSKESYKLFKGVTPETLALFGESLGLEESATDRESQVFQAYLKAAKTNRSAMKRMIERKGVNGYSEDVGRVLAGFVYSNARQASTNLHAGSISKAAAEIQAGDLRDHAIRLVEYVQNPAEEAQTMRGLLFANYIGGSIASALVNLTQTATTTWPVLSQRFGVGGAAAALQDAVVIATKGAGSDTDLAAALKRAEEEGITAPQETHNLQAQAAGRSSLAAGDGTGIGNFLAKAGNAKNKVMLVWGKAFGWAEQTNRKIAFTAAYKLSRERGDKDPFGFAKKTVAETQYVMNKGNNQVWARGAVGATLFTFRKFSVNYLEGLARMWGNGPEGKRAFALSLAVMFLLAGTAGFPFAEDLEDAIDFVAQRVLGKNWHTKEAKRQFFADVLGNDFAEFVTQGISGLPGVPIDVSGRLGMGNVIPGTGFLQKKRDYGNDFKEFAGAAGDFVTRLATAGAATAQGDLRRAGEEASPTALKNLYKALQMAQLGYYTDAKGRKVIDTTMTEAVLKGIGFQPQSVANVQEATRAQQLQIEINKLTEQEIADIWARGRIERKPELVQEAKDRMANWNRANPDSPISIDASQINRRVQQANMDKAKRIAATAPKEIRGEVRRQLEERIAQ